jgi:hypothetical protein
MYIVETSLRPLRLAVCFSTDASTRAKRRAFRLVGSRWGGGFDLLFAVDRDRGLSALSASLLQLGDPDFVVWVDRRLDEYDWDTQLSRLDLQPFATGHAPEGIEAGALRWAFEPSPTALEREESIPRLLDVEDRKFSWRRATYAGLLLRDVPGQRVTDRPLAREAGAITPSLRSVRHLSPPPAGHVGPFSATRMTSN